MPLDPAGLREAFGAFPTGVTVVTARTVDGLPVGFTANSFTSVSLDPALLLVCPGRHLSSFPVFESADAFGVSILSEGQERISNLFASRGGDRFSLCRWTVGAGDVPLIEGRAAGFSCKVHDRIDAGDHVILLGRIMAFDRSGASGLGYGPSGYFSLGKERDALTSVSLRTTASVLLDDGCHLFLTPERNLPSVAVPPGHSSVDVLRKFLTRSGVEARLGVVYALYDEVDGSRRIVFRGWLERCGAALVRHSIEELADIHIPDSAVAAMLSRFAVEFQNRSFGLYVGDSQKGDVIPDKKE